MKKLLYTILLLVFCFLAKGQGGDSIPKGLPSPYSTNYYRIGFLKPDSGIVLTGRDTLWQPRFYGSTVTWQHAGVDTAQWFYNGIRWVRSGQGGSGGGGTLNFLYGGNALGPITNLNIDTSLIAGLNGSTGTIYNKKYPLYLIYPLYAPDSQTAAIYQAGFEQEGFLDSISYQRFYNKQNAIQYQLNGSPIGSLGGIVHVNFGSGFGVTTTDSTITVTQTPSGNNNITWVNTLNNVIAGPGVATVYKGDTGILLNLVGDTMKIKVQKDTLYARNLMTAAGTDTMDFGGPGAKAFFNTYANMRGLYSITWDSLGAGLYFNQVAHKTPGGTDSALIIATSGQVFKAPYGGGGGSDSAIWKSSATYTGNQTLNMLGFSQTFNGNSSSTLININNSGSGGGILAQSGNVALSGQSVNATGAYGQSTNGFGIQAGSTNSIGAVIGINPSSNNTTAEVLAVQRNTSGTPANGIGNILEFDVEDSSLTNHVTNQLRSKWTNVNTSAEVSQFEVWGVNAGANAALEIVKGSGQIQLPKYGVGNFTGTAVYNILEDASGNLIEGAVPVGAADSAIWKSNGTYTANHTLTMGAFSETLNGTANSSWVVNNSATSFGTAIKGVSSGLSGVGVYGQGTIYGTEGKATGSSTTIGSLGISDQGAGVLGFSSTTLVFSSPNLSTSVGVFGISDQVNYPGIFQSQTTNSAASSTAVQLQTIPTTGNGANGLGTSIDWALTNGSGTIITTSRLTSVYTNVTAGSESTSLNLYNANAGTLQLQEVHKSTGQLQLNNYTGTGSFTVTPVGMLVFDASGNIGTQAISGGGSSNSNIGSGYRLVAANVSQIKTLFCSGCTIDSTTNTNALTITVPSSSFTRQVITSGSSGTVTGGNYVVNINPASTLAAFALTMPASPSDLQEVEIHFGGTITTGVVVTSFTATANAGQTFKDGSVPTAVSVTASDYYKWRWYNAASEWERVSN
jgi:hypothetical protein